MNECQCISKNNKKCTREASTKKGDNPKFCWQHQQCANILAGKTAKSTVNEQKVDQLLSTITKMNINYFDNLDYVDIRNLCKTNKQFANLCNDNTLLRTIIYNKNKYVDIPQKFDIAGTLIDIYKQIIKIITKNYPKENAPKWVKYEEFMDQMIRDCIRLIIDLVSNDLDDYIKESENNKYNDKWTFKIEIFKYIIGFAYYSENINMPYSDNPIFSDLKTNIKFSHKFINYVKNTYNKTPHEKSYFPLYKAIAALLLVNYD